MKCPKCRQGTIVKDRLYPMAVMCQTCGWWMDRPHTNMRLDLQGWRDAGGSRGKVKGGHL